METKVSILARLGSRALRAAPLRRDLQTFQSSPDLVVGRYVSRYGPISLGDNPHREHQGVSILARLGSRALLGGSPYLTRTAKFQSSPDLVVGRYGISYKA